MFIGLFLSGSREGIYLLTYIDGDQFYVVSYGVFSDLSISRLISQSDSTIVHYEITGFRQLRIVE